MARPKKNYPRFPDEIFVRVDGAEPGENMVAYREQANAIEDDGPTAVATYRRVLIHRLGKKVVEVNG